MVEAVVVDDSQFMRVQIEQILEAQGIDVAATAHNGKAGVDAVATNEPDVITMDVKMPGMDGIEAVERIMARTPTPILMLSQYTEDGSDTTFEALAAGAVDFFPKPGGEVSPGLAQSAEDLADTVRVVAQADVEGPEAAPTAGSADSELPRPDTTLGGSARTPPTLVVAASTGGPTLVQSLLSALPTGNRLRTLVVQHMPDQFTDRYASRLDKLTGFAVHEATPSGTVGPDEVVVASGGSHLRVTDDEGERLAYESTDDPPVHSVRPAADVTLESAAGAVEGALVAVVLTGMGADGAAGLEAVQERGGATLVQDPAEANIPSMPEQAIETGAVDTVRSVEELPAAILDALE